MPVQLQNDDEIQTLIDAEHLRQSSGLEMIPSENHASKDVMAALGSCLTSIQKDIPASDTMEAANTSIR